MTEKINSPKISVILTSFNHAKYLRESIDSTLSQTYQDFELIIWDDASTDGSWEIIQSYKDSRIKKFRNDEQKRGVYGINKAISDVALGNYIAIHHSDDVWAPSKLEEQVLFMQKNSNYGAVFSQAEFIDEEGNRFENINYKYFQSFNKENRSNNEWILYILQNGNPFCHPSVLIKKECYELCGYYRYGLAQTADLDMWFRLLMQFNAFILPKKLVKFRVRDNNANTSAVTIKTELRAFYESTKILENLKKINTKEQIFEIFKVNSEELNKESSKDVFLAMALDKTDMIFNKDIIILDLLFNDINAAGKQICTRDLQKFVDATGMADPFNYLAKFGDGISEQSKINELQNIIDSKNIEIHELKSSTSWKITAPIRMIKNALNSSAEKFKGVLFRKENECINSTTSHYQDAYFNSLDLTVTKYNIDYVPISGDTLKGKSNIKVIAFYLPQFHPIPENDINWGKGFTEWNNVSKAIPQFLGHYQPRLPGELGYYDLRLKEVQIRQIELAKQYGIYGFCYHHYWFDGKRVLNDPFDRVLLNKELDFPFCLCWANENWTRKWDGSDDEIIFKQNHSMEDDLLFFQDILPALKDSRYIKVNGLPVLIVYRPLLLPDPAATARLWRNEAIKAGLPGLYIVSAATFGFTDYEEIGYDGLVQFPPHNTPANEITNDFKILNPSFEGHVFDYNNFKENSLKNLEINKNIFPSVMMGWDNTARKPTAGHLFYGCNIQSYKDWLSKCFEFVSKTKNENNNFVFINAWNEWAEGTYLEPDRKYGYAYLNATAAAIKEFLPKEDTKK